MNSNSIGNLFANFIVLSLGLIFLVPSVYKIYTYCDFRYQSVSVQGIIERPLRGRDLGGRPLVRYKDLRGNVYEFKSAAKTHWFFAPEKGEKIKVFFLKTKPQNAIVDSKFHYVILPLFFILLGAVVVYYVFKNSWHAVHISNH